MRARKFLVCVMTTAAGTILAGCTTRSRAARVEVAEARAPHIQPRTDATASANAPPRGREPASRDPETAKADSDIHANEGRNTRAPPARRRDCGCAWRAGNSKAPPCDES
jgi:hypothetical protein